MDQSHSNIYANSRKHGKHLSLDERGIIQALHHQGMSLRSIAAEVGCAHTTVMYELRRSTPQRRGRRGRIPIYTAKRGQDVYNKHRKHCRKPYKLDSDSCEAFIQWMSRQVRTKRWSLDMCVGYAKLHQVFAAEQIPCTKTLYNMLWAGKLPLTLFDVPHALSHKQHRKWNRKIGAYSAAALMNVLMLSLRTKSLVIGKLTPLLADVRAGNLLCLPW
ncbi:helix-turn-helix domain-containing protein [Pectinatus cerevisiiphilus]|uniref:helix-turn-helix domain-containing protein n=1 Tax=Pectinatus cerevisiiphilus TaxID=86956 RepID=UPI001FB5208E|nr:helix-turn-helix domain-containing protein [Pectinatus cerevisiiphilus]